MEDRVAEHRLADLTQMPFPGDDETLIALYLGEHIYLLPSTQSGQDFSMPLS
jgi:hypothetical protein